MRFGVHVSIGGGFALALQEAKARKCETIQLFSRNPRGWKVSKLDLSDVAEFRRGIKAAGISPVAVHMPYLPNLAAAEALAYRKSIEAVIEDLGRADTLGAQYVVTHMGKRKAATEAGALKRMIRAIDRALAAAPNRVMLLLENTAGMGSDIGSRFSQLQTVIEGVKNPNRLGVVLDTAHLFEAGYDLRTRAGLDQTLREFDATVGLKKLCFLHLNDSKTDLGSHVDRHWHIGKGEIGSEGFRRIVNHPLLRHLPGVLETPKDSVRADWQNLKTIRALAGAR